MLSPKQLENLVETVTQVLPEGLGQLPEGVKHQLDQRLQITLQKMDLVTREEFEVQQAVLAKTRAKLEALEKRLTDSVVHDVSAS